MGPNTTLESWALRKVPSLPKSCSVPRNVEFLLRVHDFLGVPFATFGRRVLIARARLFGGGFRATWGVFAQHSFFRPQKKKIDDGNEQMNNEIHIQQSASLPPQIYHANASLQKNDNPAQRRVHSKLTQHPTKLGTPSSGDHRNAKHKCNFT